MNLIKTKNSVSKETKKIFIIENWQRIYISTKKDEWEKYSVNNRTTKVSEKIEIKVLKKGLIYILVE